MIPYIDRSNDGQGSWFGTKNAVKITMFTLVFSSFLVTWSILWSDGAHVRVYERLPVLVGSDQRLEWPGEKNDLFDGWPAGGAIQAGWDFIFFEDRVAIRETWDWSMPVPSQPGEGPHDGTLDWPEDFRSVPVPLNGTWIFEWEDPADTWMPGWMRRIYPYDGHLDIPAIMADYVMPILWISFLITLLLVILFRSGLASTMRDAMIAIFTGFILVYFALTIIGVAFRGEGQQLVPFWEVPNLHDNPAIQRYVPPDDSPRYALDSQVHGSFSHG
jgi:hypothetical protein